MLFNPDYMYLYKYAAGISFKQMVILYHEAYRFIRTCPEMHLWFRQLKKK